MVGAGTLAGRDAAVAVLARAIAAAADGQPGLVLVAGEPGIGKTALLTEVAGGARAVGVRVLWGQCWEGEGAPPYWPWIQVLRTAGEQPAAVAGPDDAGPTARFAFYDSVVRLLAALAEAEPLVVVLDDLHWADDASLVLLEFAARHLHQARVLLLGAYRDLEAPPALHRVTGLAESLPLFGLDSEAVATVMAEVTGDRPTGELATEVRDRTGGNPLFVREMTRLLVARGGLPEAGRPLPFVLDSVRETLRRRLARLSQECARILAAAAVAGPRIRPDLLRLVLPDLADGLGDLLTEAAQAQVLVASPESYGFSHELFRETLYAGLNPADRARLHRACGTALETLTDHGTPTHPAEIAAQFTAAVMAGDDGAVDPAVAWSRQAAREAVDRLAADDARAHYERALRVLDAAVGGEAMRVELLLGLADAANRAGDANAARKAYLAAADLARRLADPDALAGAAIGIHGLGAPSGLSHAEPVALLEEAAEALSATGSPRLPLVLACLARDLYHSWERDQLARATTLAEQAVDLARRGRDPDVLAPCLLALHDTRWLPGSADARLAVVDEMLTTGNQGIRVQALLLRAAARLELGDPRAHQDLTEYCAETERYARGRWRALSRRATTALIAGDLATARALSHEAALLGERIGEPDWSSVADSQLWEILRFTGERDRYAESAHNGDTIQAWPPWRAIGLADRGDTASAAELMAGFDLDRGFRPGSRSSPEPWTRAIVAEAVAAAGTPAQRREMLQRLTPLAGTHVVPGGCAAYGGAFDHYLGLLAASLGDTRRAQDHLASAIAMYERIGAPAWRTLARRHLDRLATARQRATDPARPELRRHGDTWALAYAGREVHLPDLKGLHDLAVLVDNPGRPVHVTQLLAGDTAGIAPGADPVLDPVAKAAYQRRLTDLETEIDAADGNQDPRRAERARLERDALMHELAAAAGLGGRDRRLGDDVERARKTVSSRIRDAVRRLERDHPDLARHLHATIATGVWCAYTP